MPRANSCCSRTSRPDRREQQPTAGRGRELPRTPRPEQPHRRGRRRTHRRQRLRRPRPSRQQRPGRGVQRVQQAGEQNPELLGPTVEAAQPAADRARRPAAVGRDRAVCPAPAARASRAAPITATLSARRSSIDDASSTCVRPQPEQHERRGRCRTTACSSRTGRQRACPHGRNRPWQSGQRSCPTANNPSNRTGSVPTVSTGCLRAPSDGPPARPRTGRAAAEVVPGLVEVEVAVPRSTPALR
jgi:hypothetical protein